MMIKSKETIQDKKILFFILLSFSELFIAAIDTIIVSLGSTKSIFLGLSTLRLILVITILVLAFAVLFFGLRIARKYSTFKSIYSGLSFRLRLFVSIFSALLVIFGIISLFVPSKVLENWSGYLVFLQPLSTTLGVIVFQFWGMVWATNSKPVSFIDLKILIRPFLVPFATTSTLLLALSFFIYTTKTGLVFDTAYWNVPGIPVTGLQLFVIMMLIGVLYCLIPSLHGYQNPKARKTINVLIPIVIYITAFLVWCSTPMLKHFFSLEPTPPNYQPYPFSDARDHDLGAISILNGLGINFNGQTDKPLYMVFLAFLHLFSGNNYILLTTSQLLVLALIPVIIFFLGKKFNGILFGLSLAALIILQQRNAIILSHQIASVNPKLLVTEEITLLCILLCVYLLFLWMKSERLAFAILLGGIVGVLSLIRLNPLILVPMVVVICFFKFRNRPNLFIKQFLLFSLSFTILFAPWLITGVDSNGLPWIFMKFSAVEYRIKNLLIPPQSNNIPENMYSDIVPIENRYTSELVEFSVLLDNPQTTNSSPINITNESARFQINEKPRDYGLAILFINHFLHNFSTSFLALPDSSLYTNLDTLRQRVYWHDDNQWMGNIPGYQLILIIINLLMFSVGISYSWRRYRWIGLIPLAVFFSYDLALSAAFTSGSRYIVPINWILFFYYALGILSVMFAIISVFKPTKQFNYSLLGEKKNNSVNPKKPSLLFPFILILLIASLIPITNTVLPKMINLKSDQPGNLQGLNFTIPGQDEIQLVKGQILYPYYNYNRDTLSFDFLSQQTVKSYVIEQEFLLDQKVVLESQDPAILGISIINDEQILKRIYIIERDVPILIWKDGSR